MEICSILVNSNDVEDEQMKFVYAVDLVILFSFMSLFSVSLINVLFLGCQLNVLILLMFYLFQYMLSYG